MSYSVSFLSTPSARRATKPQHKPCKHIYISIHALREEGDIKTVFRSSGRNYFYPRPPRGGRRCHYSHENTFFLISIHALREEGDLLLCRLLPLTFAFLSTPSARRATAQLQSDVVGHIFLSTPSARRATEHIADRDFQVVISIHALREEGDIKELDKSLIHQAFLSTPSARRATETWQVLSRRLWNFYPRPPRGGRQNTQTTASYTEIFLSTPSARRATS